jgi:hypothetical protein
MNLVERTHLGIERPTQVAAGRSRLRRVFVNAPGEVKVYDARTAAEATASNLIYYDARPGMSEPLTVSCSRGIFVQPLAGAVVALHFFGTP